MCVFVYICPYVWQVKWVQTIDLTSNNLKVIKPIPNNPIKVLNKKTVATTTRLRLVRYDTLTHVLVVGASDVAVVILFVSFAKKICLCSFMCMAKLLVRVFPNSFHFGSEFHIIWINWLWLWQVCLNVIHS